MEDYSYLRKYRKLSYQERLLIYEKEKSRVAARDLSCREYEMTIIAICKALNI